jgi:hypothetical protein
MSAICLLVVPTPLACLDAITLSLSGLMPGSVVCLEGFSPASKAYISGEAGLAMSWFFSFVYSFDSTDSESISPSFEALVPIRLAGA